MPKTEPGEIVPKATGPQIHALYELLQALPLEERRELRRRLQAAYLEDPTAFVKGLPKKPMDVESVRRWRLSPQKTRGLPK